MCLKSVPQKGKVKLWKPTQEFACRMHGCLPNDQAHLPGGRGER
jgi:hypothetical protein